jgi:hypothetical protein
MFDDTRLDDTQALAAVDDGLRVVAQWGAEVRRAATAAEPGLATLTEILGVRPRAVVAAGPDGRLLRTVLEPVCPVPFVAWPHAGLPGWAGPLDLVVVLCAGRGSETDETTVAEAVRRGCDVLLAAPLDTLALAVPVLGALHRLGLGPDVGAEPVAQALDQVALQCGPSVPSGENPAKELALVLADHVPVLWGSSPLAGRAARRIAEGLRAATGVPAVAGDDAQIVPLLEVAPEPDVFADPFDDDGARPLRPTLVVLDDGTQSAPAQHARARLEQAASQRDVRVHEVAAANGPDVARFATLMATGRFAARYLQAGDQR